MTEIRVEFTGVDALLASLEARAVAGEEGAKKAARKMATTFIAEAKKNATGPPRIAGRERRTRAKKGQPSRTLSWGEGGPGVVTGFMRNSIQVRGEIGGAGHWEVTVHPGGPYYRRLELGFSGTDSLGRKYRQPPYPFMRPALATTRERARSLAVSEFRAIAA